MSLNYSSLHEQLLQEITTALPKSASKKTRQFTHDFYALSTVTDLKELSPARAACIALTCETFFATRLKAGPKISIQKTKVTEGTRKVSRTQIMLLNDDMPFLVDSLSALFTSLGLSIHLILHPILNATRNKKTTTRESLIYVELSPPPAALTPNALSAAIETALAHVAASVADWAAMRDGAAKRAEHFSATKTRISTHDSNDSAEIHDLLLWLSSNHFVFLGLADYTLKGSILTMDATSALGIYRLSSQGTKTGIERASHSVASETLTVLKASAFSLVHRHAPMDLVVLKRFNAKGKCIGETRILGLFTSTVYYRETQNIPLIRRKAARVITRAGFDPSSH